MLSEALAKTLRIAIAKCCCAAGRETGSGSLLQVRQHNIVRCSGQSSRSPGVVVDLLSSCFSPPPPPSLSLAFLSLSKRKLSARVLTCRSLRVPAPRNAPGSSQASIWVCGMCLCFDQLGTGAALLTRQLRLALPLQRRSPDRPPRTFMRRCGSRKCAMMVCPC